MYQFTSTTGKLRVKAVPVMWKVAYVLMKPLKLINESNSVEQSISNFFSKMIKTINRNYLSSNVTENIGREVCLFSIICSEGLIITQYKPFPEECVDIIKFCKPHNLF